MKTECYKCHQYYDVDAEYLNCEVECPECGETFFVQPRVVRLTAPKVVTAPQKVIIEANAVQPEKNFWYYTKKFFQTLWLILKTIVGYTCRVIIILFVILVSIASIAMPFIILGEILSSLKDNKK